jgi:hypothetical protein
MEKFKQAKALYLANQVEIEATKLLNLARDFQFQ